MKRALSACLCLGIAALAAAQNWPQFRGPNASGVADGANPPTVWNAEKSLNILWKTAIPGSALSSPVVWGDRIFVTTAISSDPKSEFRHGLYGDVTPAKDVSKHVWKVYALDKNTGKIVWERTAYEGVPKTKRHPKSSQASSTPATDGKRVIAFFGSEGLYCYDFDGKLLWKQDLGVLSVGWFYDPDYEWGVGSSPIIYKNLVIVQCDIQKDSFIAAFDVRTGKPVWRTPRDEIPSWGTPTVYESQGRAGVVTNSSRFIRGYDALTGRELWRIAPNSEVTVATPVAAHNLIFVTAGYPPVRPIYAIRTGAQGDISLKDNQTSNQHVAWSNKQAGTYIPTPIVHGDYFYTLSNNAVLTCYNASTGARVYQQRLAEKGGAFSASPVAADGKLYFSSEDGEIFVVKAGPQYELLAVNPIGEVLMATPAIARGMLVVRSMRHVYGIGESSALKSKGAK